MARERNLVKIWTRRVSTGLVLVLMLGGLMACGKKANHVDAPEGDENIVFPRVYPDPATDPAPTHQAN